MSSIVESLYSTANINESVNRESAEDILISILNDYVEDEQKLYECSNKIMKLMDSFEK